MLHQTPLTENPAQLRDAVTRLSDHLDLAQVDTRLVMDLLRAGALREAAEVACDAARHLPGVQDLRLETATLAAIAFVLHRLPTLQA
ncbi:hypothetical protein [Deinococcus multiflagellatus]|uniref:Uncharacterized protein n=1 Tax=Deinococcus multiflagellatus TaxID=1656887 RepID=A0ABW1ZQQ6_9DEIO|nr:hypothetical protein [Deinococcus multiflagellatus]MBZ9715787.1 hypothetical protein [Deinococcus multiflagellatus]